VHCFKELYAAGGVKGMWAGVGPNVARAMAVNLGELATYDTAKGAWMSATGLEDSLPIHVLSAFTSGFVACACSTPFDVIKTRMMSGQFTSMLACAQQTVAKEGVMKLYSGFLPGWARLGPWQFFFWVSYEQLRKQAGIEGF
jgi:solute carrier family 25 uncoupling protein 27